jgi:hypothetical protein
LFITALLKIADPGNTSPDHSVNLVSLRSVMGRVEQREKITEELMEKLAAVRQRGKYPELREAQRKLKESKNYHADIIKVDKMKSGSRLLKDEIVNQIDTST